MFYFIFVPTILLGIFLYFSSKQFHPIEQISLFVVSGLICFGIQWLGVRNAVTDTEFLSNTIERVTYYEYWESYEHRTCTKSYDCNCSTDSKGLKSCQTCTTTYDCSYCDTNPEKFVATLNNGKSVEISKYFFNKIKSKWAKSERFVDLDRIIDFWGICGKDGDSYVYHWDGSFETQFTFTKESTYENRLKNSTNILVDRGKYDAKKVYDYPKVKDDQQKSLVGYTDREVEKYLQWFNGEYGQSMQIKYFVFVWNKSIDPSIVEQQKNKLERCNKNEFILCLFVDDKGIVKNVDFITWSDEYYLPILQYKNIPLKETVEKTGDYLTKHWKRLEFSQFKYITVYPDMKYFAWAAIVNIIVCGIMVFIFYGNELKR